VRWARNGSRSSCGSTRVPGTSGRSGSAGSRTVRWTSSCDARRLADHRRDEPLQGDRPDFPSLAKAFNTNFAAIYDEIPKQRTTPSCPYCADDEAREVTQRLIRDAGYEPTNAGGLDSARALEDMLAVVMGVSQAGGARVFYRFGKPGEL
jgi:hypothetical protein